MEHTEWYAEMERETGIAIASTLSERGISVVATSHHHPELRVELPRTALDEARILYMEAGELLRSRVKAGDTREEVYAQMQRLFNLFKGEKPPLERPAPRAPSGDFVPNPGKVLAREVDGTNYLRLPVKTRLINLLDKDLAPLLELYVKPYLKPGDTVYVSEKALCIAQQRVVDMSDIHPTKLARLLARKVGTGYGTSDFHGFGHGTDLAMQLFIEEAGVVRVLFAAAAAALTRPFGIRGLFYRICGVRAKSIDCPMSFLILDYAHSAKLAPQDPNGAARRFKELLGCEVVILDANYRGAFSLGKSTRAISEAFIGELFGDNPLGQSDEMTPFCIVRKQ